MKKRTTRTFSIDDTTYSKFKDTINRLNLNQSKLIESLITKWMTPKEVVIVDLSKDEIRTKLLNECHKNNNHSFDNYLERGITQFAYDKETGMVLFAIENGNLITTDKSELYK